VIEDEGPSLKRRVFRRNELAYREDGAPDWDAIGEVLKLAMYNFVEGRGLSRGIRYWRGLCRRR
jgi:hypothetical protein